MNDPIIKAFVLCNKITDSAVGAGQKDLHGAGLTIVRAAAPFPIKRDIWVYIEIADRKPTAIVQLVLVRADSGRQHLFREVTVRSVDPLQNVIATIRLFDCVLPEPGVYFIELWYDGFWLVDQRFEVIEIEGE